MTTSRTGRAWTHNPELLSKKQIGYYRARLRNRFHQAVLRIFEDSGIKRAEMARRLYKRPEVITRLLGAPGNWTLDTYSDLLLSMGYEPVTEAALIGGRSVARDTTDQLAPLGAAGRPPVQPSPEGDTVLIVKRHPDPKPQPDITEQEESRLFT